MGDPRAFTVACPRKTPGKTADRRSFGNAVGKVGDLQVLNDIGASKIGTGLRTLASVSNSIRTGCGALPTSIGNALDAGANWVLENTGIAPTVVNALQDFHPAIANQAYGQAKQIFQKVKQGNFKLTDIPGALQDFQNLERLGRNIFTPSTAEQQAIEICEGISPYAIDLLNHAPKYKFLFVVQFVFNSPYTDLKDLDFAFVVKTSSRPNVKIDMEDVNYYNFRSKFITKTSFEEMKMSFHDDTGFGRGTSTNNAFANPSGERGNNALRFYNAYMRATSPITNNSSAVELLAAKDEGMEFAALDFPEVVEGTIRAPRYSASSGPLASSPESRGGTGSATTNIISEIKLFHVYNYGHNMNVYKFFNPRISSLMLDDLDMAASTEGSEVSLSFNYDSVYIDTGVPLNSKEYSVGNLFPGALYPLRYNATGAGGPLPARNIKPFGEPDSATTGGCSPNINTSS